MDGRKEEETNEFSVISGRVLLNCPCTWLVSYKANHGPNVDESVSLDYRGPGIWAFDWGTRSTRPRGHSTQKTNNKNPYKKNKQTNKSDCNKSMVDRHRIRCLKVCSEEIIRFNRLFSQRKITFYGREDKLTSSTMTNFPSARHISMCVKCANREGLILSFPCRTV